MISNKLLRTSINLVKPILILAIAFGVIYVSLPTPSLASRQGPGVMALSSPPELRSTRAVTYTQYIPLTYNDYCPSLGYFGVQVYEEINSSTGLNQAVAVGAKWMRWPLSWAIIEPADTTPEHYNWSYTDTQLTNAYKAGINVIATLTDNPSWAATYKQGPVHRLTDLMEFMKALAERYDGDGFQDAPGSPVARYWQLYNEPDNTWEYFAEQGTHGYWGYNGAAYAQMLAAIYPEVKKASPDAQVVMGGLAHDAFIEDGGPFDRNFLDDVLSNNGGQYFDVMAFHYYIPWEYNWVAYGPGMVGKTSYIRSKLAQYNVYKPIICTETGQHTRDWSNDERQSRFLVKTFVQGIASEMPIIIWFTLRDLDEDQFQFGLLKMDLTPKPAYYVYETLTRKLSKACYVRPLYLENLEGYLFDGADGKNLAVIWATGDESVTLPVAGNSVDVTDKQGSVTTIRDADDRVPDGWIQVEIGPSPVYLEQ